MSPVFCSLIYTELQLRYCCRRRELRALRRSPEGDAVRTEREEKEETNVPAATDGDRRFWCEPEAENCPNSPRRRLPELRIGRPLLQLPTRLPKSVLKTSVQLLAEGSAERVAI